MRQPYILNYSVVRNSENDSFALFEFGLCQGAINDKAIGAERLIEFAASPEKLHWLIKVFAEVAQDLSALPEFNVLRSEDE